MTDQDYQWLRQNERLLYQSIRYTQEEAEMMYAIFNRITGLNKRPNGCSSCLRNTTQTVKLNYEKYKQTNA